MLRIFALSIARPLSGRSFVVARSIDREVLVAVEKTRYTNRRNDGGLRDYFPRSSRRVELFGASESRWRTYSLRCINVGNT